MKALIWVGKNLARAPFGRRWRTVRWLAKISGLMTPSSLVSDKRFSNTSKLFFCSYFSCGLMINLPSHAAVRLGQYLFPLFALALDLPEDFFSDKVAWLS